VGPRAPDLSRSPRRTRSSDTPFFKMPNGAPAYLLYPLPTHLVIGTSPRSVSHGRTCPPETRFLFSRLHTGFREPYRDTVRKVAQMVSRSTFPDVPWPTEPSLPVLSACESSGSGPSSKSPTESLENPRHGPGHRARYAQATRESVRGRPALPPAIQVYRTAEPPQPLVRIAGLSCATA
jgi:hypothetical protein